MSAGHIRPWIVSLAWLAGAPVLAQTGTAYVERVIDGDTLTVRLDGGRYTVRLTGVDTPETTHPTQGVEPDGPEAAAYTARRLTGATVRLDADPAGARGARAFSIALAMLAGVPPAIVGALYA